MAALNPDRTRAERRSGAHRRRARAGLLAVVLSFALYVLVFVIPFLPGSTEGRLAAAAVLYGSSYVAFFLGGALLGPTAMAQGKARLRTLAAATPLGRLLRGRSEAAEPPPAKDPPTPGPAPASTAPTSAPHAGE